MSNSVLDTQNSYFGLAAELLPVTAWFDSNNSPTGQFAWLEVTLLSRSITSISATSPKTMQIRWNIHKVI